MTSPALSEPRLSLEDRRNDLIRRLSLHRMGSPRFVALSGLVARLEREIEARRAKHARPA